MALDFYIKCFWDLHTTRGQAGPISFLSIHRFCEIMDIKPFDEFYEIIRKLDSVYLSYIEKKQNGQTNAS